MREFVRWFKFFADGCWLSVWLPPEAAFGAEILNWQEATARLAQERTQAITCMALLKKYGGASANDRGALTYGEAKGESEAITQELLDAFNDPAANLGFSVPRPDAHLGCDRP